jgi:hypothetical protein
MRLTLAVSDGCLLRPSQLNFLALKYRTVLMPAA